MWFPWFVAAVQIMPFMALRMVSDSTKLLQESSAEQQDSPKQAVERAQKQFAQLNARFEEKLRSVQQAKTKGQEVSKEESEEVEQAHKAADEAHALLDKAVAALRAADAGVSTELPLETTASPVEEDLLLSAAEAQQKLLDAKEHFAVVDKAFKKKLEKEALAKKLNIDLPAVDREALDAAHQDAINAQKSVDAASNLVLKAKKKSDAGVKPKANKQHSALLQRELKSETTGSDDGGKTTALGQAQEKLENATKHFNELNAMFTRQLYVTNVAKQLQVPLSPAMMAETEGSHRLVVAAQQALDEAQAAVRQAQGE